MSINDARAAALAALRLRNRVGIGLTDPANPIDIAEKIGVSVRFLRAPSMEGMLIHEPSSEIVLSSLRPAARINFTCAHELGHYWYGHSIHVDAGDSDEPMLLDDRGEEAIANRFASSLLMPKTTVQNAFVNRNVEIASATPQQVLAVANWLGVGYRTLVHGLRINLKLLSEQQAGALLKNNPKAILYDVVEKEIERTALIVDRAWRSRPVDLLVGEAAIVEGDVVVNGDCVEVAETCGGMSVVRALVPGTGLLVGTAGWSSHVRVARSEFEGRSIFRFLEEVEDDGE